MSEQRRCSRCDGCGQIADTDEGEPWSSWMALPVHSAAAVLAGIVKPLQCPACNGTGQATDSQHCPECGQSTQCPPNTTQILVGDDRGREWHTHCARKALGRIETERERIARQEASFRHVRDTGEV